MRLVFHHLPILMALLILATGLSLASAGGANAHPPLHNAGHVSSAQMELSIADHGPTCASAAGHSDTAAEECCHMAGANCGGAQAFCTPDATIGIQIALASIYAPRPAPHLIGCTTPVAQRPPAIVA